MAFKGPTRTAGSVRDLRAGGVPGATQPEQITPPKWLTKKARTIFLDLVSKAVSAGIPTKELDSDAFAMAAQYTLDYREAKDPGLRARIGRDLLQLQKVIGATPEARIRMGIKGGTPQASKTAKLLALVKNESAAAI